MQLILDQSKLKELRHWQGKTKERWQYVRVTCVLMLHDGFSLTQVCQALGIDDNSVYRYAKAITDLPTETFLNRDYQGYFGKLDSRQLAKLNSELLTNFHTTCKQVCQWVEREFGVCFTCEGIAKLLHRLGFSYKRTKQVPCKADKAKQEAFLEQLAELLAQQDAALYFLDGVHPTHNTRSLYGWIPVGKQHELPANSGRDGSPRDRININGALNAKDVCEVIIEESERINAETTKQLYEKLIEANPDKNTIYVIADNARYYKNKMLTEWIKDTKIVQVFLPAYSPNLNLIERLWKFLRKKVIDPIFYESKAAFRQGVLSFFENIAQYKDELHSLLTLNFRTIDSQFNFS